MGVSGWGILGVCASLNRRVKTLISSTTECERKIEYIPELKISQVLRPDAETGSDMERDIHRHHEQ